MPELPEVDAARRGIAEQLLGRTITSIELRLPKLLVDNMGITLQHLVGQHIHDVRRHGKYLTLVFDDVALVVHLKLAGQLVARGETVPGFAAGHPVPAYDAPLPHKSTHLIVAFGDATLYLTDIRHFARVYLMPLDVLPEYFERVGLGPDVNSSAFTRDWFREAMLKRKQARVKPLLLEQSFVAGLGNIYVDEVLYQAHLHPERLAASLSVDEIDALYAAILAIMEIAIPLGGAHILNGKAVPENGAFPFVHGREGQPCVFCGASIVKCRVNNRGTYLCPVCQMK